MFNQEFNNFGNSIIILGNLLSDLFVALIDPRVKFD